MGLFSALFGGVVSFFTPPTVSTGQNMAGMVMSDMGMEMTMDMGMDFPEMEMLEVDIPMYEVSDSIFDNSDSGFGDSGFDSFGSDSFSSDSFGSSF